MPDTRKIGIPDDLDFSDLHLKSGPEGHVSYEHTVMKRICDANGIDVVDITEDTAREIVVCWYAYQRTAGGEPDPVAENLFRGVPLETLAGRVVPLPPGEG